MPRQQLKVGMRVKILEKREHIDDGIIVKFSADEDEIEIKSLVFKQGITSTFVCVDQNEQGRDEWRMIIEDPMSGRPCIGTRAPTYVFEIV